MPFYRWKALYTTNYDTLIEQCFAARHVPLIVYESNFDFGVHENPDTIKLFKLHGSIDKDIVDGHSTRIILTDHDYDYTQSFREGLFDRSKSDLYGAHLIIIGHSLADEDIKSIANRAAEISSKTEGVSRITLLMYSRDVNRAALWEKRGFNVCFGGLDGMAPPHWTPEDSAVLQSAFGYSLCNFDTIIHRSQQRLIRLCDTGQNHPENSLGQLTFFES